MSNPRITGLNDRNRPLSDRSDQSGPAPEQDVFVMTRPETDPRDEGFFQMLRINVCPGLQWYSFAVVLSILLVIIFAVQVGVDGLDPAMLSKHFLPTFPNPKGAFGKYLVLTVTDVKKSFQFWRFLSALFLHQNALHLLSSIVSLLIWASLFERLISPLKIQVYFFLGGVIGYIFTAAVVSGDAPQMGASPGVFAIFGGSLGFLIYNWKNMDKVPSRLTWMLAVIFIMVFSLLFSTDVSNLLKQLGGFLAGLSVGLTFSDKYLAKGTIDMGRTSHETTFFFMGLTLLGLLFLVPMSVLMFIK